MMMSVFDYSLLGIRVLLHAIFSLDGKVSYVMRYFNCFLRLTDCHKTMCASKQVPTFQTRIYYCNVCRCPLCSLGEWQKS